jgi:hypothetical protein
MASVSLPPTFYRLQAGNPAELIRDTGTDDLGKLWERLMRYQVREGVTEILVTRHAVTAIGPQGMHLGPPTPMIAMHRATDSQESPWEDIVLVR